MSEPGLSWTEERVELLSRLWSEGLSASQIAAALGGGVTRNAVIGKVHRLGLSGRVKPGQTAQPRPAKPREAEANEGTVAPLATPAPALAPFLPAPARPAVQDVVVPVSQRVTILELRDSMCRWPLGDPSKPDFAFCGGRAATGHPYCEAHCRIAYQPAAERRRLRA